MAALLLLGLPALMFAQAKDDSQRDRMKETAVTGCLNKDSAGGYVLTDEKTGAKTPVTGTADLDKHSANHKVTLTGTAKADATGKTAFEVSKIQHISPTCKAPE
jgi:hypothetical protein